MLMLQNINDKEGGPKQMLEPGPPVTLLRYCGVQLHPDRRQESEFTECTPCFIWPGAPTTKHFPQFRT